MELKGRIKKIFETQTFASGFQKRELVILTEEQYPQPILIEFLSEKVEVLNSYQEGDQVTIGINIRGREWTNPQGETKYFNSITGWKINKEKSYEPQKPQTPAQELLEEDDDLPF